MDVHYQASTVLLLMGYALYTLGVSSDAWKSETGYEYGLWYRCDWRECVFYKVDYLGSLNLVRIGVLLSCLLLAISAICLIIEVAMVISRSRSKHKQRLGKTVVITAVIAELVMSLCLGCYGYTTLTDNDSLPSLSWGFAATGGGVIVLVLGTIVRVMGPSSSWSDIPCLKSKAKRQKAAQRRRNERQIYKPRDTNKRKPKAKSRPTKLMISHPSDIITYRKASEPLDGSCENLLVLNRQDSTCSSPHRYEEIALDRDYLSGRRRSQTQINMTSSNHPSPRFIRDLSPRKSTSLPPGISPGFYAQVHRNPKHRVENPYAVANGGTHSIPRFQTTLPSPRFQPSSPFRPIRVLTIDKGSVRSVPIPTPPPSPPLPPPPPPLSSTTMPTTVNIRRMNSVGSHHFNPNAVTMDYAPSPTSLHSFGSYAY